MFTPTENTVTAGVPVDHATKVLIMVHGRGARAEHMIPLRQFLAVKGAAVFAPQAPGDIWYPYSFLEPQELNQPALDNALRIIDSLVNDIAADGIPVKNIYFLGFSQGACLILEYATRNARRYGGIVAFTGGLIGKELVMENYKGDFKETPVLITTGYTDTHVPLTRVKESGGVMQKMNAVIKIMAYPNKQHAITDEEIQLANSIIFREHLD